MSLRNNTRYNPIPGRLISRDWDAQRRTAGAVVFISFLMYSPGKTAK
jgi:hypothetical protein